MITIWLPIRLHQAQLCQSRRTIFPKYDKTQCLLAVTAIHHFCYKIVMSGKREMSEVCVWCLLIEIKK